jgi:hypothetical protein
LPALLYGLPGSAADERRDGVTVLFRTIAFGLMGGVFSVAATFLTVGFKHQTFDELLWVACLFVVASIACGCAYRANPENAWDLFTVWRKIFPVPKDVPKVLVVVLALGVTACGAKTSEIAPESPFTIAQCEAMLMGANNARAADDLNSATLFLLVAKRGGCY